MWALLALTLAATAWVAASESTREEVQAAPLHPRITPSSNHASNQGLPATTPPDKLIMGYSLRAPIKSEPEELFPGDAPQVEAVAKPQAPPKPVTPSLPFVYAGKLGEDGKYIVFLSAGERNLTAHVGDVIDQTWRIDSIDPYLMKFTYLPLNSEVKLTIGANN